MNVLITGCNGQIGWELARGAPREWTVHATDRAQLDLGRPESIASLIRSVKPEVIINAAGYTAVDRAEDEPDIAQRVNADAVGILASEARACGAALVHYSTDYIFDGTKTSPYAPEDAPNPQSVYGRTKLAGERAALASRASVLILRTQWVYALRGRNFVLAILRQASLKPELRIVSDQTGSPTWARAIARATIDMVSSSIRGSPGDRHFGGHEGAYHLACAGSTTWFDFARAVFEETKVTPPRLTPVSTQEYAAKASRPAHSTLDCSRTASVFGVQLAQWRQALHEAVSDREAFASLMSEVRSAAPTG
jgi:dTDP-4-dehydrorhamnose reductase